jgi:predicted AlkP superfamily pyrophosphatase or phosphodiesterase
MPNLDRLKSAGVWYTHSHSVSPTVTRVNSASISTGTLPSHHGIASNSMYLPAI